MDKTAETQESISLTMVVKGAIMMKKDDLWGMKNGDYEMSDVRRRADG